MQSQKSIVIDNFAQMLPEVPQGSDKNKNFLIANANPVYYKGLGTTIQEEQFAPLCASTKKATTISSLILDGNICYLFKDDGLGLSESFVATDKGYIYYFSNSSYQSFPVLTGILSGNKSVRGIVYAKKLIATAADIGYAYYNSGGGWTPISGIGVNVDSTLGIRSLENFKTTTIISDSTFGSVYPRYLRIIDASLTATSDANSLDLGENTACRGLKNFNDKYLAIAVNGVNNSQSYIGNYIYLWDGNQVTGFQYSVKIPGLYQGMEVIKGILYVLVGEKSGVSSLYYLSGIILKKLWEINYGVPSVNADYNLFNYFGSLGINLDTGLLVWDREDGLKFFLNKDAVTMYVTGQSGEELYSGVGTTLYKETGTTFNNLDYKSQYFEASGVLNNVEIFYDQPPTGANKISVYIDAVDENSTSGSIGNLTTQLIDIDSTTALNSKRTLLDGKGIPFSKIRVRLTTTGNWGCIIRKIKLNFSPITGQ